MSGYNLLLSRGVSNGVPSVDIPGSKSYTNRALLISAISNGISTIKNVLYGDDTLHMIDSLIKLGVNIEKGSNYVIVHGNAGIFNNINNRELFCGIAGTTSRFLTALSLLVPGEIIINGEKKILQRPIGDLVNALRQLGSEVRYLGTEGSLPLKISNEMSFGGNIININGSISSQFISGLLMIAPCMPNGLIINVNGDQVSTSYIDITIDIMKKFGVSVDNEDYKKYTIKRQQYKSREYIVEGDWSSASYFFAIGAILKDGIIINNINQNSTQGDSAFYHIMENFGVETKFYNNYAVIRKIKEARDSFDIDMGNMPDTAMTAMVLSAIFCTKVRITNIATLKNKESDRIEVPKNLLQKFGIICETTSNSITIYGKTFPNNIDRIVIDTHDDHRVAMSFSLLSLFYNIVIQEPNVIDKSFPGYWTELSKVGINISSVNK